jgi:hypothetical protein
MLIVCNKRCCCYVVERLFQSEFFCLTYTLIALSKRYEYSLNCLIVSNASRLCSRAISHLGVLHKTDRLLRRCAWLAMLDMAGQGCRILGITRLAQWSRGRL